MSKLARYRKHRLSSQRYTRCVNCSILIPSNKRQVTIEKLNDQMTDLLRSWVIPTTVSSNDLLCVECYILLKRRISLNGTESQADSSPAFGHKNVCFGCGISILRMKPYRVPLQSPLRSIILKWIPAHQVSRLEKVCRACWMAVTRLELRESKKRGNIPVTDSTCTARLVPRQTYKTQPQTLAPLLVTEEDSNDVIKKERASSTDNPPQFPIQVTDSSSKASGVVPRKTYKEKPHTLTSVPVADENSSDVVIKEEREENVETQTGQRMRDRLLFLPTEAVPDEIKEEKDLIIVPLSPPIPHPPPTTSPPLPMPPRLPPQSPQRSPSPPWLPPQSPQQSPSPPLMSPKTPQQSPSPPWLPPQSPQQSPLLPRMPRQRPQRSPSPPWLPPPTRKPRRYIEPTHNNIIQLPNFGRTASTSSRCVFSGCKGRSRNLVPTGMRQRILFDYNIFIPRASRVCSYHIKNKNVWEVIQDVETFHDFNAHHVEDMLWTLRKYSTPLLFDDIEEMNGPLRHFWLGVTPQRFNEIIDQSPSLKKIKDYNNALAFYLAKLRTGYADIKLSSIFGLPRTSLQRKIKLVRDCLAQDNVPLRLGISRIVQKPLQETDVPK